MRPLRAIVLGVEHPRGLAVVRSLGAAGIPVVAVDHDPTARGLRSRYLGARLLVPAEPERALGAIASLADEGGVLIPANDRYLSLVSKQWKALAHSFVVAAPPWDVLGPLMRKPDCYAIARAIGIATPTTFTPHDLRELEDVLPQLDLGHHAYVLSVTDPTDGGPADPRTGRLTRAAGTDVDQVRRGCRDILERTGHMPMLAEVIPGEARECTGVSMVVDRRHEPVVAYCVRRLQMQLYARGKDFLHPYELGANVFCESVHDPEAVEAATALVRHAHYWGAITVEFRRSARDGRLVLVKADPRVVRATSLSRALGLDVPLALYRAFTTERPFIPVRTGYRERVAWVWLTWYLTTALEGRHRIPLGRQLLTFLRALPRVRAGAYVSVRDPVPFLVDSWRWARDWTQAGRRRVRRALRLAPTRDFISGRERTASMLPGGQSQRRAAAGEAGAADVPDRNA